MKQHHSKEAGRKTAKGGADGSTTTSKVVLPLHLSVLPCSPLLVGGVLPSSSSIVGLWCIPPVCIHIFAHPLDLFVSDQNKQGGQNGEKTARPPKRGSHQHHPKERRGRHPKGKMEKYLGGKEHTPNNEERRTTKREHSSHHQRRKGGKHHSKEGCTQKQHHPQGVASLLLRAGVAFSLSLLRVGGAAFPPLPFPVVGLASHFLSGKWNILQSSFWVVLCFLSVFGVVLRSPCVWYNVLLLLLGGSCSSVQFFMYDVNKQIQWTWMCR